MANNEPADGPRLRDYAPTTPAVDNAWRLWGLAKAIKSLAAGEPLDAQLTAALDGIISEAENLP